MTAISLYNTNYTAFLSTFAFTLINEYSTKKYATSKMGKNNTQRSSRQTKWKWWTEKHTSRLSETIKLRRKMYYVRRKDRKTFGMLIEMDKTTMFDEIESIDHKTRNIINYHNFHSALLSGPMDFIKEKNGFVCAVSHEPLSFPCIIFGVLVSCSMKAFRESNANNWQLPVVKN